MKKWIFALVTLMPVAGNAQGVVNDATTPLHLLKPAYRYDYGVPGKEDVKASIDRVLEYLDNTTPAELDETGKALKRGDFRLTSYEWGVTYSAMLRATQLTDDRRYAEYAMKRMNFLAQQAPRFIKMKEKGEKIDALMEQVVSPDALDDCGAICCAMLKAKAATTKGIKDQRLWDEQIAR